MLPLAVPSRKKLLIAYVRESAGVLGKQCRRTGLMGSVSASPAEYLPSE